ncbi:DEAD/DEAH box helicase [Rhizodiscina lignyota]|uniref:RNA helicase n=1 Tax=Rhizodiscina lignyota TaxID=1504668 RepID=A0A9P4MH62_9PEZI|nr:DEAD/DEAH box helicase [Rhizodiscina lignyota]
MPKNAHPPRGSSSKKPATKPVEEDTSFIEFTNKKGDSKKSKKPDTGVTQASTPGSKGKGKELSNGPPEDGPKKPDTRTLIGGASWTGKLPVNMLSEHCQKQKWDKPEYSMNKVGQGFVSAVILRATNPKTRESTTLPPFRVPPEHKDIAVQPTAVEARHFAAAYTLFRIANMKNLHMMMPPTYKDLWKGTFQDIKKEDEANGKAWMYEADPFATVERREAEKVAREKKRLEEERERERRSKDQTPGIVMPRTNGSSRAGGADHMKGWTKAPKVDMGKRTRQDVERVIRNGIVWNRHGIKIDIRARPRLVEEISAMGFRKSHVEEAADVCKDREEILEWLLIHVPEDDLPKWALPDNYTAGVTMASGNLQREAALKRLAAAGYAVELCEEALGASNGEEAKAAAMLQHRLLDDVADHISNPTLNGSPDVASAWQEERDTLQAIYGDRFVSNSKDHIEISLEPVETGLESIILRVTKPPGQYPDVIPIVSISASLPAYIRMSITKQVLQHARDNFVGEPMIFNIVDWLENNIASVIDNPGSLRAISSAAASASEKEPLMEPAENRNTSKYSSRRLQVRDTGSKASSRILETFRTKESTPAYQTMLQIRRSLPAWQLQVAIIESVIRNPVTIISGETGSGKSTQSVQFILDDLIRRQLGASANIICTQPRRISAMGLAERVADERCAKLGEEVGYAIRGESKLKVGVTQITFVTTGVLLRRLQTNGGNPEDVVNSLADVSHVVVDEVHERSLDTDFLLVLLRDVLKARKDLRVILMSATLDAQGFEQYFRSVGSVGMVEIQGRTHPVMDYWLDDVRNFVGANRDSASMEDDEDSFNPQMMKGPRAKNYDLIAQTVHYIDTQLGVKDGGILIFLPGTAEIDRTIQALRSSPNFYPLPLHASLLPADQRRVFPPAPAGKRKVVCATNVAETSITIPDIVAVIDTGRVKETAYDPATNMVKLAETWASRAACKQRRGRAGRVRAGTCYKLFTKSTEERTMAERPEPEIRRVPLEQLVLSVKSMGIGDVSNFLAGALTPPDAGAVDGAVQLLRRMGALEDDDLTSLGRHLASIPADLRCAKLMVYGAVFSCLEASLTIASILTARSPFVSPPNVRDESKAVRTKFGTGNGDLIADLRAYEQWQSMKQKGAMTSDIRGWCAQNYLSMQTLNDISSNRGQYLSSLKETGFLPLAYRFSDPATQGNLNKNNGIDALLRALIAASFTPQIARIDFPDKKFAASVSGTVEVDPEARTIKYFNQENGRVFMHPGGTLFDAQGFPEGCAFVAYFGKMATSKVFVREVTPFNPYTLLLFGGPITLDTLGRGLLVDDWIRLRGWARIGVLVSRLRMMLDEALAEKIDAPQMDLSGTEVVRIVRKLVELNGLDR